MTAAPPYTPGDIIVVDVRRGDTPLLVRSTVMRIEPAWSPPDAPATWRVTVTRPVPDPDNPLATIDLFVRDKEGPRQ